MFWEVGLLVTTLAAAISTSIGDEPPQGGSGFDATGAIVKQTDPFGGLDANGVIINNPEFPTISDEDMDFYNENSIDERKACHSTPSCKRAGGSCIKRRAKCNGTVGKKNCKCGKKCKCCIPEVCKHANSCSRAGGSCIKGRAKCDGTVDLKGCKGGRKCKCCMPVTSTTTSTTTTAPTTSHIGSTVAPCPSYITTKDNERFVILPHKRMKDWHQARLACEEICGTDLYEPKNSKVLAMYLEPRYRRNFHYWVGAQGNGLSQVWFSEVRVPRSAPWYQNYYLRVGGEYCMKIMTHDNLASRRQVLAPFLCTDRGHNTGILCG